MKNTKILFMLNFSATVVIGLGCSAPGSSTDSGETARNRDGEADGRARVAAETDGVAQCQSTSACTSKSLLSSPVFQPRAVPICNKILFSDVVGCAVALVAYTPIEKGCDIRLGVVSSGGAVSSVPLASASTPLAVHDIAFDGKRIVSCGYGSGTGRVWSHSTQLEQMYSHAVGWDKSLPSYCIAIEIATSGSVYTVRDGWKYDPSIKRWHERRRELAILEHDTAGKVTATIELGAYNARLPAKLTRSPLDDRTQAVVAHQVKGRMSDTVTFFETVKGTLTSKVDIPDSEPNLTVLGGGVPLADGRYVVLTGAFDPTPSLPAVVVTILKSTRGGQRAVERQFSVSGYVSVSRGYSNGKNVGIVLAGLLPNGAAAKRYSEWPLGLWALDLTASEVQPIHVFEGANDFALTALAVFGPGKLLVGGQPAAKTPGNPPNQLFWVDRQSSSRCELK